MIYVARNISNHNGQRKKQYVLEKVNFINPHHNLLLNNFRLGEPKILCEFSYSKNKYHIKATFEKYIFLTILIFRFNNKLILLQNLFSFNNDKYLNNTILPFQIVYTLISE